MDRRRLLTHPTLAVAVFVLLLNDQWGKAAWPGAVTGKLSDLAGVYAVAIVLGALVGRAGPALALTGVGFALLKIDADVARLAAPLLGGVTRPDATDLVALVVLWPAARVLGGRERVVRTVGRDLLVVVLGLCTVATTTATSCDRDGVRGFGTDAQGGLWAKAGYAGWARSSDRGRTWTVSAPDAPAPNLTATATDETCARSGRCFRVVGDVVQERTGTAEWRDSFAFTSQQRRAMEGRSGGSCAAVSDQFASVIVLESAGAPVVLVGAGEQGVLRREGDGPWQRLAVGAYRPISDAPVPWAGKLAPFAPVVLLVLSPLVGLSARRGRRLWTGVGAFGCAVGALLLIALVGSLGGWYSPAMYALAVMTALCLVATVVIGRWPRKAQPTAPPPWPPPST